MGKNLQTKYLGLSLRNPVVVASCPLSAELDNLRRMEELGAAAAVMPSLFEEQIERSETLTFRPPQIDPDQAPEATSYYRRLDAYNRGPEAYLRQIELAKKAVSIPIIASLNGTTKAGWTGYAKRLQEAGADAVELNMYYIAADPATSTEAIEARYLELLADVRAVISIPLAVKLGPYFSALANMARRLNEAGADGLVLFNRFLQPDVDLRAEKVTARWRFSTPDDLYLPLRWIAILKHRVPVSLAASGGIHNAEALAKVLLAGADIGMVASILYRNGVDVLRSLVNGLQSWLDHSQFNSIEDLKGLLSQRKCRNPDEFERALYAKTIGETVEATA